MTKKAYTFYLEQEMIDKGRGLIGYGRPYSSVSDMIRVALEHELEQYSDGQIEHWEIPDENIRIVRLDTNDVPATELGPPLQSVTLEEYKAAESVYDAYIRGEKDLNDSDVRNASDTMERYLKENKLM